jgi:hypothetical protein
MGWTSQSTTWRGFSLWLIVRLRLTPVTASQMSVIGLLVTVTELRTGGMTWPAPEIGPMN